MILIILMTSLLQLKLKYNCYIRKNGLRQLDATFGEDLFYPIGGDILENCHPIGDSYLGKLVATNYIVTFWEMGPNLLEANFSAYCN